MFSKVDSDTKSEFKKYFKRKETNQIDSSMWGVILQGKKSDVWLKTHFQCPIQAEFFLVWTTLYIDNIKWSDNNVRADD